MCNLNGSLFWERMQIFALSMQWFLLTRGYRYTQLVKAKGVDFQVLLYGQCSALPWFDQAIFPEGLVNRRIMLNHRGEV